MTKFATADSHWNHTNIIKYTNRPFNNIDQMNNALINNWNERVGPHDTVYHLGDVTLSGAEYASWIFSQLNGHIIVLSNRTHHDRRWIKDFGKYYMNSKSGYPVELAAPLLTLELQEYSENGYPKPLVLSHFPIARWDRCHYNSWHIHGHCHCMYEGPPRSMDVGVDCNNYAPVSLEEIAERMKQFD